MTQRMIIGPEWRILELYHAINHALGHPARGRNRAGKFVGPETYSVGAEDWTPQEGIILEGPGPTIALVVTARAIALEGRVEPVPGLGNITISVAGHGPMNASWVERDPIAPPLA
jgi:hypothetical protein